MCEIRLNPIILYNIPRSYYIYIYISVCVWNIPSSPEMGGINHQAHFRRAVARRSLGKAEEAREDLQAMGNTWINLGKLTENHGKSPFFMGKSW